MTTMWRKVKCTACEYEQTDSVSYYLHAKAWKANHDLEKCLAIRKGEKVNVQKNNKWLFG